MQETTHYDTVIVGGGLAGLTAAAQLAQSGHRPLVLERHSDLGGRARTDDLGGWLFNHGGHALYKNGLGHRTLQGLGVEPSGVAPPLDGAQLVSDGRATPLPFSAMGVAKTKALSARGKLEFGALLTNVGKLDPAEYSHVTVDDWLAGYRPDVRAVVTALVRLSTYSAATDIMSADAAIAQLGGNTEGVLYLHGGWAALCAQIAQAAESAGATLVANSTVDSIRRAEGGYTVTTAAAEYQGTTVVVAAGGPAFTSRLLGIDESAFGMVGPAPEAAVLDLALDQMPTRHRFLLGVDEPTYFSVHSPPARMAPDGKVAAVAMRYLAPSDDGTANAHRSSLESMAELAGIGTPVHSRFMRRMTVTNGLPIAAAGGIAGRPKLAVPSLDGAFIAGDWVGARGLLADAAIASGHDAAVAASQLVSATTATPTASATSATLG